MHGKWSERIRRDLEQRGVAPEFSRSISHRLAHFGEELTPEAYEAVLSGVTLAYGVHRQGVEGLRRSTSALEEVQRLMAAFAGELGKLEEALETLAAYVTRMRCETSGRGHTVH